MYVAAVAHPVADYDKWKAIYDETSPTAVGGAKYARVNRLVGDPNQIMVLVGFESLEMLKGFMASHELKGAMDRAGVVGEPRVEIYEEADAT